MIALRLLLASFLCLHERATGYFHHNQHNQWLKKVENRKAFAEDVGEPLYLTPYLQSGDVETAKDLSKVTDPLDGVNTDDIPQSYSGFITVNPLAGSHLFFWFFEASDVDPSAAPLVVWLQGGPGASSMFGLFEIHGPVQAVSDGKGGVTGEVNPWAWTRAANVIYLDQPAGTGFSHTRNGFASNMDDVATDLYEFMQQWLKIYPEFQDNRLFIFGESYGGKYVPAMTKRIHDENQKNPEIKMNLQGLGIGNGLMDPPSATVYADFMYQLGLISEIDRDFMKKLEEDSAILVEQGDTFQASRVNDVELDYLLEKLGCGDTNDYTVCFPPYEENNYQDYVDLDSTRKAAHVGTQGFGVQKGQVYGYLEADIFRTMRPTIEFLLEEYPFLMYFGSFDIICHHSGNMNMFDNMETWSGLSTFRSSNNVKYYVNDEVGGYLRSADNLRLFVVRNAGHKAPRDQPEVSFKMFTDFLSGQL